MSKTNKTIENTGCPHCGRNLFDCKTNKVKLRTNILIFEKGEDGEFTDGGVICKGCGTFIKVPVKLDISSAGFKHYILEDKKIQNEKTKK